MLEEEEEDQRLELISLAIRKLLDEKRNEISSDRSSVNDDRTLLFHLLSQIESMKKGAKPEEVSSSAGVDTLKTKGEDVIKEDTDTVDVEYREEIVKELKNVKRQNSITHCLLSVMIVLTVVWQLSEVSIILSVKNKISNPFKSLGSFLSGALKRPAKTVLEEIEKNSSKQNHDHDEALPLPLPLPHVDLPEFGFHGAKH